VNDPVAALALPRVSAVLLTMGDRPDALARAVAVIRAQRDVQVDIVVVGNGCDVPDLPADVRVVVLPENVGIPAGRNRGWEASTGELVAFLDDDGWLEGEHALGTVAELFAADDRLGIVSLRIADPEGGGTSRRHVPRLRASDPLRGGEVTTFLGGACVVRRAVLDECGGLPDEFFYAHEETDLAWRALDGGWSIRYEPHAVLLHPVTSPARHAMFYRFNARNRVWLARRRLPWPLVPAYTGTWLVLTVLRTRDREGRRVWWRGFREGWRTDAGERAPMSWRTVARMTRLGRPPVI
jgi:GT2 family glycosyltransferase